MKKIKLVLPMAMIALATAFFFAPQEMQAKVDDPPADCCWKQIDCPGWFTGDYEACLTNGDGNSCSCGGVTRTCI